MKIRKRANSLAWVHYALFFCLFLLVEAPQAFGCRSDGRYLMGTILEITLCEQPGNDAKDDQQTFDSLFAATTRLDSFLSIYSPESVVSLLNAQAGRDAYAAPPEVRDLLTLSHRYWRLTRGAFDITIGPFMKVWSRAGESQQEPSPAVLQQTQLKVGTDKIELLPHARVRLTQPGMAIDLGGIGKGYAIDQLTRTLQTRQIQNALLDFGQSSIWALGSPPDAPHWRLLVQRPDGRQVGVLSLRNQALSVSASFAQTFVIQGRQYGHIIDPRSGLPLQRDLLACVVAPDAAQAEALSKALLILGEQEGVALLERLPQTEGFLSDASGRHWMTTGWREATRFVAS